MPDLASSDMAAASERVEVDTARPFQSVKEAVAVFGERLLIGSAHFTLNANPETIPMPMPVPALAPPPPPPPAPATLPMHSAPASPPSCTSSPSLYQERKEPEEEPAELRVMRSIRKLEAELAETRHEVVQLKKRGTEMELAVASLNAQLHRSLSKMAEMEAEKAAAAARRSIGEDGGAPRGVRSERWGEKTGGGEHLPSLGHALSLGELDEELSGMRKRRLQRKKKPIVPLISDVLFCKWSSTSDASDGFYTEFYSVLT